MTVTRDGTVSPKRVSKYSRSLLFTNYLRLKMSRRTFYEIRNQNCSVENEEEENSDYAMTGAIQYHPLIHPLLGSSHSKYPARDVTKLTKSTSIISYLNFPIISCQTRTRKTAHAFSIDDYITSARLKILVRYRYPILHNISPQPLPSYNKYIRLIDSLPFLNFIPTTPHHRSCSDPRPRTPTSSRAVDSTA